MRASLRKTRRKSFPSSIDSRDFSETIKIAIKFDTTANKVSSLCFHFLSRCKNACRQLKNVEQEWNNRQNEPGLIVDIESIKTSALGGVAAECKQQRGGERSNKRKPRQHRSQYWSSQKQLQLVSIARLVRAGATHRPNSAALVKWVFHSDKKMSPKKKQKILHLMD